MEVKKDKNSLISENMKLDIISQNIKGEAEEEILKKTISNHPLFGLLLHSHLHCLQVCSGDFDSQEIMNTAHDLSLTKLSLYSESSMEAVATSSELDKFMEAYCSALQDLKEAMERPLIETHCFVDAVYTQLNDIVLSSSSP